jgi:hypothetical protein
MSNDQINAEIAKACGWTGVNASHRSGKAPNADYVGSEFIPDYCADLNAMHQVESLLSAIDLGVMAIWVARILPKEAEWFHASARQRAEAFLRMRGLWEDSQK